MGSLVGIIGTVLWNAYVESGVQIEGALIGIMANFVTFYWIAKGHGMSDITDECVVKKAA